uniref:RNA-binding protein 42 n=1 Tax=Angiostrongylus cantonensis TaxID=6313 RepID=A0A0K0DLR0_ANGCA
SAPKIYNADPSTSNVAVGQSSTAPVTFVRPSIFDLYFDTLPTWKDRALNALASDIEAMEKKNEHPSAPSSTRVKDSKPSKPKKYLRAGGGQVWEDPSLAEWDKNDFRIFCGDLGNEVSDELLAKAFRKYPSFQKAKVVRDSRSNKSKGYGFVSFTESDDYVRAMREMDGKYVGNRPIKLRKSNWKERNLDVVKKKQKQKAKLGLWS